MSAEAQEIEEIRRRLSKAAEGFRTSDPEATVTFTVQQAAAQLIVFAGALSMIVDELAVVVGRLAERVP